MANANNHLPKRDGLDANIDEARDDARIRNMLETVSVPVNLNERIKSRLRMNLLVDPCLEESAIHDSLKENRNECPGQRDCDSVSVTASENDRRLDQANDEVAPSIGHGVRRTLLVLAIAAALSGLAFLANSWRQPNERDWLVKQCQTILSNWEQDNLANLDVDANLSELPSAVREQLARMTLRGTRSLAALGSKFQGSLYRLDTADGQSLIMMRLSDLPAVRGLNSRFSNLTTPSGGWSLMALQMNNETYVLAGECTEQQLMHYIRRPVVT